jgi:DNA-binding NarL/FixJ family response regulator
VIRLLIADDHPVVRAGLQGLLASQHDFDIVAEAQGGNEAVTLALEHRPDVVLMDLQMPDLSGTDAIRTIRAAAPEIRILVLSSFATDGDVRQAIEAGASSYLLKDAPRQALFDAVRATARGEMVLTPTVAASLMQQLRAPAAEALSGREQEVLELVAKGYSNKQIAKALGIGEATVKTHLIHIFGKLGVSDRTAAVTTALERRLLSL